MSDFAPSIGTRWGRADILVNPANAMSWRALDLVNALWCVRSPCRSRPQRGLSAFMVCAMKIPFSFRDSWMSFVIVTSSLLGMCSKKSRANIILNVDFLFTRN